MLARDPDGTARARWRRLLGNCGRRLGERAGELHVGAYVQVPELGEAQLEDALGGQLSRVRRGDLDPVDDRLHVHGGDRPLVGGGEERGAQLGPVESLALAVALDHERRVGVAALEGGEAPSARRALATSPHDVAVGSATALEDAGRSATRRANHHAYSTRGSGFLPLSYRYM